jgi:hypothetical protein
VSRCPLAPHGHAPVPVARPPRRPAAGARSAAAAPGWRSAPARSAATPAATARGSGLRCWPVTGHAAVQTPPVPSTPTARVAVRPLWPITGRSPADSWLPPVWTQTTHHEAEGCVPPAMPVLPPWTPGPGEDGTPAHDSHTPTTAPATGATDADALSTDQTTAPRRTPRGAPPRPVPTEQATEGQSRPVRFPNRPWLRWAWRVPA